MKISFGILCLLLMALGAGTATAAPSHAVDLHFLHPLATSPDPETDTTVRLSLLWARSHTVKALDLGLVASGTSGDVTGLQWATAYADVGGDLRGVAGTMGVHRVGGDARGIQFSVLAGWVGGDVGGIQWVTRAQMKPAMADALARHLSEFAPDVGARHLFHRKNYVAESYYHLNPTHKTHALYLRRHEARARPCA